MDETTARFVSEDDSSDLTFVIAEFSTATQAMAAFEDLMRWTQTRSGVSAWRLPAEDGTARIVAACTFTSTGHKNPIVGRLKRKGGTLTDLPEDTKIQLANRMLQAAAAGRSEQSRGIDERLEEPPPDGPRSIEPPGLGQRSSGATLPPTPDSTP